VAIKHRTKEQKRAASAKRLTYSLPTTIKQADSTTKTSTALAKPKAAQARTDLYDYHPNLIKKDLLKTLVVSAIVLGVELGLYYYL
jgi:hypothetical protein